MELLPVVLDPRSAPWFCLRCRHSWWAAELSETARKQFRPSVRDFGFGEPLAQLQRDVTAEVDEAIARGTSCREDMLELVPLVGVARMANDPRIAEEFRPKVKAELARKGG